MSTPSENRLPAIIDQALPVPTLQDMYRQSVGNQMRTFEPVTAADKVAMFNATDGECLDLNNFIGKTIAVRGAMQHMVDLAATMDSEGGRAVRTVLIGAKGELYESMSEGICRSVWKLMADRPNGPWEPPILVEPQEKTTAARRKIHKLKLVSLGEEPTDAKKSK